MYIYSGYLCSSYGVLITEPLLIEVFTKLAQVQFSIIPSFFFFFWRGVDMVVKLLCMSVPKNLLIQYRVVYI